MLTLTARTSHRLLTRRLRQSAYPRAARSQLLTGLSGASGSLSITPNTLDRYIPNTSSNRSPVDTVRYYASQIVDMPEPGKTVVIMCQHDLKSSAKIIKGLRSLGVLKSNIFFHPCAYTTSKKNDALFRRMLPNTNYFPPIPEFVPGHYIETQANAHKKLLRTVIEHIETLEANQNKIDNIVLICKDGLLARELLATGLDFSKYHTMGILHTKTAVNHITPNLPSSEIPFISFAECYYKNIYESQLVAQAIISSTSQLIQTAVSKARFAHKKPVFGIIGNQGNIGQALETELKKHGTVKTNDLRPDKNDPTRQSHSIEQLIASCDIIFSTADQDITEDNDFTHIIQHQRTNTSPLQLVSCTSMDIAFRTFLRKHPLAPVNFTAINDNGNLPDGHIMIGDKSVIVHKCGLPATFNPADDHCIPEEAIDMTRAGIIGSFVQALLMIKSGITKKMLHEELYDLDSNLQTLIISSLLAQIKSATLHQKHMDPFLSLLSTEKDQWKDEIENHNTCIKFKPRELAYTHHDQPNMPSRLLTEHVTGETIEVNPILHGTTKLLKGTTPNTKYTLVVGIINLDETSISMIYELLQAGFNKDHIMLMCTNISEKSELDDKIAKFSGMFYRERNPTKLTAPYQHSLNECALFWNQVRDRLLEIEQLHSFTENRRYNKKILSITVVDFGYRLAKTIPQDIKEAYNVVGVEETNLGIDRAIESGHDFPIINHGGSSYGKHICHSNLARAAFKSLHHYLSAEIESIFLSGHGVLARYFLSHLSTKMKIYTTILYKAGLYNIKIPKSSIYEVCDSEFLIATQSSDITTNPLFIDLLAEDLEKNLRTKPLMIFNAAHEPLDLTNIYKFMTEKEIQKHLDNKYADIVIGNTIIILNGGVPACYFEGRHIMSNTLKQNSYAGILAAILYASHLSQYMKDKHHTSSNHLNHLSAQPGNSAFVVSFPPLAQIFLGQLTKLCNQKILNQEQTISTEIICNSTKNEIEADSIGKPQELPSFNSYLSFALFHGIAPIVGDFNMTPNSVEDNYRRHRYQSYG